MHPGPWNIYCLLELNMLCDIYCLLEFVRCLLCNCVTGVYIVYWD